MTDDKNPPITANFRPIENCNSQKSSDLSKNVIQIGKYREKLNANQKSLNVNDCPISNTLMHMQAEYEANGGPRVIRANYVSVTGWIAGTHNHDPVPFESSLERDCAFIAMFEPRIDQVSAQPYTIIYKDSSGKQRRYTPDFEFTYIDGNQLRKAVIEVKPYETLHKKRDKYQERFRAMEELAETNGGAFFVLTERQIRTPRLFNTKALYSRVYDRNINTNELSSFIQKLKPHLPCKMSFAISLLGGGLEQQAKAQSHVWELLAGYQIQTNLGEPITYDSTLQLGFTIKNRDLFFNPGEMWEND